MLQHLLIATILALATVTICRAQSCRTTFDCPQYAFCMNIDDASGQCACEFDNVPDHLAKCKSLLNVRRRPQNSSVNANPDSDPNVKSTSDVIESCPNLYQAPSPAFTACLHGGKCYAYNDSISFCICAPGWAGKNCGNYFPLDQRDKFYGEPFTSMQHRRMRSRVFDSIVNGRLFASTLAECMSFCRASGSVCQSVNYGNYQPSTGQPNICEMLSVKAQTEYDRLWPYIAFDANWYYAFVTQDFNVRPDVPGQIYNLTGTPLINI